MALFWTSNISIHCKLVNASFQTPLLTTESETVLEYRNLCFHKPSRYTLIQSVFTRGLSMTSTFYIMVRKTEKRRWKQHTLCFLLTFHEHKPSSRQHLQLGGKFGLQLCSHAPMHLCNWGCSDNKSKNR